MLPHNRLPFCRFAVLPTAKGKLRFAAASLLHFAATGFCNGSLGVRGGVWGYVGLGRWVVDPELVSLARWWQTTNIGPESLSTDLFILEGRPFSPCHQSNTSKGKPAASEDLQLQNSRPRPLWQSTPANSGALNASIEHSLGRYSVA